MIKNILLPERIGDQFLFSEVRLGLEVTKTSLIANRVYVAGHRATITDLYQEVVAKRENEENDQAAIVALEKLVEKTGTKASVTLTLPNQLAIFKELKLPFIDNDKIQQILPFELEQQIPFAVSDVAFDFIITKQDAAAKQSTIFVGIVQKKDISQVLALLEKVHLKVGRITLDVFAIYNLYTQHPDYAHQTGGIALLDFGALNTSIAYVNNQQLVAVRSLNYGLNTFAKNIAEKTQKNSTAVIDHLVRFGATNIQDEALAKAFDEELALLSNQIQFTLATCTSQVAGAQPIKAVILLTRSTAITGLEKALERALTIPTQYFNSAQLLGKTITTKAPITTIPIIYSASLGAVIPWGAGQYFDLMRVYDVTKAEQLLVKQLIAALTFVALFVGLLVGYYYVQRATLRAQINKAKNSALAQLRNELGITGGNLAVAVDTAKTKVSEFESIWAGFTVKQRGLFLAYLNDLSAIIDCGGIGLAIKTLTLDRHQVMIKGRVRDIPALKTFEDELSKSRTFRLIGSPQDSDFEITLRAVGQGEEVS